MMTNENILKGKWMEMRGDIQKAWGNLTNDELEVTKGEYKAVSGLIQKKYGEAEASFKDKLDDIFHRYEVKKVEPTKEPLKN